MAEICRAQDGGELVEIPVSIFTEDAGSPENGYGRRSLSSDGRANMTVSIHFQRREWMRLLSWRGTNSARGDARCL